MTGSEAVIKAASPPTRSPAVALSATRGATLTEHFETGSTPVRSRDLARSLKTRLPEQRETMISRCHQRGTNHPTLAVKWS